MCALLAQPSRTPFPPLSLSHTHSCACGLRQLDLQRLTVNSRGVGDLECLEDLNLADGDEVSLDIDVEGGTKGDSRYKKSTVS